MGIRVNNGEPLIILLTIISWIDLVLKNIYILTFTSLNVRILVDLLFAITSIFDLFISIRHGAVKKVSKKAEGSFERVSLLLFEVNK